MYAESSSERTRLGGFLAAGLSSRVVAFAFPWRMQCWGRRDRSCAFLMDFGLACEVGVTLSAGSLKICAELPGSALKAAEASDSMGGDLLAALGKVEGLAAAKEDPSLPFTIEAIALEPAVGPEQPQAEPDEHLDEQVTEASGGRRRVLELFHNPCRH